MTDVVDHVVLVRGHLAAVGRSAHPDAEQLRELLLEGHLGDQRLDAVVAGAGCVLPGTHDAGLDRHPGQPFTAPVSPPTMRFSAARKKTSAGTIASEV